MFKSINHYLFPDPGGPIIKNGVLFRFNNSFKISAYNLICAVLIRLSVEWSLVLL